MELKKGLLFLLLLGCVFCYVESKCVKGCYVALASYYVAPGYSYTEKITRLMESSVVSNSDVITGYNKDKIHNYNVPAFKRLNIPFPCDCIHEEFLGHVFEYSAAAGDTYDSIAKVTYVNLTTVELLTRFNSYGHDIPQNAKINVPVKCFCGNSEVSKDFGLFITYPLRPGNNLHDIVDEFHVDAQLLERYNPGVNFSKESGIVFIPGRGMIFFSHQVTLVYSSMYFGIDKTSIQFFGCLWYCFLSELDFYSDKSCKLYNINDQNRTSV